jgi:hypothetical protein
MTGLQELASGPDAMITRADMYFHQPRYRDYRWLETNWFSWTIPDQAMRCHLRAAFRTNLDVVNTTCFVFNNPAADAGTLGVLYSDHRHHVPMPRANLDEYQLANGMKVKMTKPMQEWEVRYDGEADTVFDLHYKAMMAPVHVGQSGTDDHGASAIRHGHLDQMMHVTGTVRVRGNDYDVDWPAPRDHSWSPRPESSSGYGVPMSGNFDYGSFGPSGQSLTFFVQTRNEWSDLRRGRVHNAYIIDHGQLLGVKHGEGRYTYAPNWSTTHLEYELEDERGRTHLFKGEPVSFYPGGVGFLAVVRWESADGEVGWGEYNWHGDIYEMQRLGTPPL